MNNFESWLKLNSLVLRHMTVSLEQKPDKYVDKSSVSENGEDNNDKKIDVEKSLDPDTTEKNKEE